MKPPKWKQQVKCADDDRWAEGPAIELPIPPFVGLWVDCFRVSQVWVKADCPDGEIRYEPVDAEHMNFILGTGDFTASDAYDGWHPMQ